MEVIMERISVRLWCCGFISLMIITAVSSTILCRISQADSILLDRECNISEPSSEFSGAPIVASYGPMALYRNPALLDRLEARAFQISGELGLRQLYQSARPDYSHGMFGAGFSYPLLKRTTIACAGHVMKSYDPEISNSAGVAMGCGLTLPYFGELISFGLSWENRADLGSTVLDYDIDVYSRMGIGVHLAYGHLVSVGFHLPVVFELVNQQNVEYPQTIEWAVDVSPVVRERTGLSFFLQQESGTSRCRGVVYSLGMKLRLLRKFVLSGSICNIDDEHPVIALGITLGEFGNPRFCVGNKIRKHGYDYESLVLGSLLFEWDKRSRTYRTIDRFNNAVDRGNLRLANRISALGALRLDPEEAEILSRVYEMEYKDHMGYCRGAGLLASELLKAAPRYPDIFRVYGKSGLCNSISELSGEPFGGDIHIDTLKTEESPYIVKGRCLVRDGCTLVIEPGVIVKFVWPDSELELLQGSHFIVRGTTESPVIFTSIFDDIGGDSNRDGVRTEPEPNDWRGVGYTTPPSVEPNFICWEVAHLKVRYSGTSEELLKLFAEHVPATPVE